MGYFFLVTQMLSQAFNSKVLLGLIHFMRTLNNLSIKNIMKVLLAIQKKTLENLDLIQLLHPIPVTYFLKSSSIKILINFY